AGSPVSLLGRPEDVRDLLHRGLEVRGGLRVDALLVLRAELRGLPEGVVELRVLLEMLRLEVVAPEDEQFLLADLGVLLLDRDRSDVEVPAGVVVAGRTGDLFDHLRDRVRRNLRGGRVVDAAWDVAV